MLFDGYYMLMDTGTCALHLTLIRGATLLNTAYVLLCTELISTSPLNLNAQAVFAIVQEVRRQMSSNLRIFFTFQRGKTTNLSDDVWDSYIHVYFRTFERQRHSIKGMSDVN